MESLSTVGFELRLGSPDPVADLDLGALPDPIIARHLIVRGESCDANAAERGLSTLLREVASDGSRFSRAFGGFVLEIRFCI